MSSGLRDILTAKSAILQGGEDRPQHIQIPDYDLLAEFDAHKRSGRMKKYGLGGDVDGGSDEGVGGGNPGIGDSGGGGWSGGDSYSSGADYGGVAEGMSNYGEANGYGGDFNGGSGGEASGNFGNFGRDFGDGRTSNVGYNDGMRGVGSFNDPGGWSTNDISSDVHDAISSGDWAGGGEGDFMGLSPSDFNTSNLTGLGGVASFGGLGGAFGGLNEDGRLSNPTATANTVGQIGTNPLSGTLADFAPGPMQTMSTDIPPDSLTGIATAIAPDVLDFAPEEEDELVPIDQPPNIVQRLMDWDPRSATSLVHPDRRALSAIGITENKTQVAKGNIRSAQMPMEVAMNRALVGYGPQSWETRRGLDRNSVYGQAFAPSQFSGIKVGNTINNRELNNAMAFAHNYPDQTARVRSVAEDIIQGRAPALTEGALSFRADALGAPKGQPNFSMDGHTFHGLSPKAEQAYAAHQNRYEDANPAFNVPAGAPPAPDVRVDIDPANVNLSDIAVGPALSSPSLTVGGVLGEIFGGSSAYAAEPTGKLNTDRAPTLENAEAYPTTYDANAVAREAMGPVNAQRVDTVQSQPPSANWDTVAAAVAGLAAAQDRAVAQPALSTEKAAPRANFSEIVDDAFPGVDMSFDATARARASMPGSANPQRGPAMPGLPGYAAEGLPSGLKGSRMSIDPSVGRPSDYHEVDAPPAGARIAGGGVMPSGPTPAPDAPRGSPRATATADVYGPTMPGMLPGTEQYPERGVIAQPSTAFHEKVAERLGPAAIGMAIPGSGIASMISGMLGGPTLSGVFGNSAPGLDLSLGFAEPGDRAEPQKSEEPKKSEVPKTKPQASTKPMRWTPPLMSADDSRAYRPPKDPRRAGYEPEHGYFYAQGGLARERKARPALSQGALSMTEPKRTPR